MEIWFQRKMSATVQISNMATDCWAFLFYVVWGKFGVKTGHCTNKRVHKLKMQDSDLLVWRNGQSRWKKLIWLVRKWSENLDMNFRNTVSRPLMETEAKNCEVAEWQSTINLPEALEKVRKRRLKTTLKMHYCNSSE